MSIVDDDTISNVSNNRTFEQVLHARVSRRSMLAGSVTGAAAAASLGGVGALLNAVPAEARGGRPGPRLGFEGIPPAAWTTLTPGSDFDKVIVPKGYTAKVLIAWGDPVSNGPAFDQGALNTSADQEKQWGMHNDGLVYFPLFGSDHGLIVQNHEYTDDVLLFSDGTANWNAEKTKKSLAAHGVGIIEVRKRRGKWEVVRPSFFARRITGYTPIKIAGPAAGHDLLKTNADPTGKLALGTLNNCAMGYTPWGSYLACEENFNGYFRQPGTQTELERRYGITAGGFGYLWHTTDDRFDTSRVPNEPNRFGWVTEIYPYLPGSMPVKRTALGRFKHEGAWVQEARDGRVVVYSGDDEQFEYIYRYVSRLPWKKSFLRGIHPLDDGTLYVAKFNPNNTGEWLPLTPDNPALSHLTLAQILINTRGAADLAGATKMDRPEWIDTFPNKLTAIATLTNNSRRGAATAPTAPVDAMNPRAPNTYGHIIQWSYYKDWTEPAFYWEIFALAGDPANAAHGSTIIGDKYGSPDGIYVDPSGLLWIQTDVSGSTINTGSYAGFGNNQMLAADPDTRETRRFLTGPNVCEITGVFMTPDRRTMFVGVQHPGEAPTGVNIPTDPKRYSNWPDGDAGSRPRSSLIVVTKDDGGVIGS
jgi:secreted PhoX family phosphatase